MSKPNWSNQKSLLHQLQRLWDRGEFLRAAIQADTEFPLRLVFKSPNSQDLSNQYENIRNWLAEIEKLSGYRIEYKTVQHKLIGKNKLPYKVWIDDLETAIHLLNKQTEVSTYIKLYNITRQRAPELLEWTEHYPLKVISLAYAWPKLLDFLLWRKQHPHSHIYLRQVNLPGIDTKFIEQHRSILITLLDLVLDSTQINPNYAGVKQFEKRYGFRSKPDRIRFRITTTQQSQLTVADNDITLTAKDFSRLNPEKQYSTQIKHVFITENEINFLSFPLPQHSLVIFGAGYGFDALRLAGWLAELKIYYWGDIDSHGFAILNQLRHTFPHVKSLLMDEKTLTDHQHFWGEESKPENKPLSELSEAEQVLYQKLVNNHYQENLRLEQERINFEYLSVALKNLQSHLT